MPAGLQWPELRLCRFLVRIIDCLGVDRWSSGARRPLPRDSMSPAGLHECRREAPSLTQSLTQQPGESGALLSVHIHLMRQHRLPHRLECVASVLAQAPLRSPRGLVQVDIVNASAVSGARLPACLDFHFRPPPPGWRRLNSSLLNVLLGTHMLSGTSLSGVVST